MPWWQKEIRKVEDLGMTRENYSLEYGLMQKCYLLLFYFSLTLFLSSGSDQCAIMGIGKTCISDVDWVCSKGVVHEV